MTREEVRRRIEEIGVIPAIRVSQPEDALLAAEAVTSGGIPIVEVTMTVPGAVAVIAALVKHHPELVVGAGTVWDVDTAERCLDAGAHFLTSTGLDREVVEYAHKRDAVVLPGAMTPTEIMMAWKAGCDFVKVFPCAHLGGPAYIKAMKAPFPKIPLVAAGGINQQNAGEFITAGAAAVGVGAHLVPRKSIELKQSHRIHEMARRFVKAVHDARSQETS